MKKFAILGASGHGKVVAEIAQLNGWSSIVFFDDQWPDVESIEHWPVAGNFDALLAGLHKFQGVAVAIGNNHIRLEKHMALQEKGASLPYLIHPSAVLSRYAAIGAGTVVMAGSIINPFARIGESCIINSGAVVEHDCVLSNGVHLSPQVALAGGVEVGPGSWIGIGSSVKQLVRIGTNVTVGAGSAVVKDLPDGAVAAGIPAKPF